MYNQGKMISPVLLPEIHWPRDNWRATGIPGVPGLDLCVVDLFSKLLSMFLEASASADIQQGREGQSVRLCSASVEESY